MARKSDDVFRNLFLTYVGLLYGSLGLVLFFFKDGVRSEDFSRPGSLVVILVPLGLFCGLPVLGYFYLKHRTRTRIVIPGEGATSPTASAHLEISFPQLREDAARRYGRVGIGMAIFFVAYSVLILTVFYPGLTQPDVEKAKVFWLVAGALIAAGAMIVVVVPRVSTAPLRAALKVTALQPLTLVANETGLTIPIFLLTDPAFFQVARAGRAHLHIPWSEITAWSVEAGAGKARPQHVLSVSGESAAFGQGTLGSLVGGPRIGILRAPIGSREAELLAVVKRFLGASISVNDELNLRVTGT